MSKITFTVTEQTRTVDKTYSIALQDSFGAFARYATEEDLKAAGYAKGEAVPVKEVPPRDLPAVRAIDRIDAALGTALGTAFLPWGSTADAVEKLKADYEAALAEQSRLKLEITALEHVSEERYARAKKAEAECEQLRLGADRYANVCRMCDVEAGGLGIHVLDLQKKLRHAEEKLAAIKSAL
jgi:hypothetical protein